MVRVRSRDEVSLVDFAARNLAAEQREAQKKVQLRAAIAREREAAGERQRNADMAIYIERELHDRGVRNVSRDDIVNIMPEVRDAASKIYYGSQTEMMAFANLGKLPETISESLPIGIPAEAPGMCATGSPSDQRH